MLAVHQEVLIPAGLAGAGVVELPGFLTWPSHPRGVIVFAHGSGSSRFSARNQFVAGELATAGFATLLFDLLTADEGARRELVFNIEFLARRLADAEAWLDSDPARRAPPLGYFGASTGAAAALAAAADPRCRARAVVSRGGRPDLAGDWLPAVRAATLLIVGENDHPVVVWNEGALARLRCPKNLAIVPDATHLFGEPGALEAVARWARDWFARHLSAGP